MISELPGKCSPALDYDLDRHTSLLSFSAI
jgi:hypothetical protein